ncbi:MAG: hypothetical protein ABWK01_02225 [Infirmifilum sp.]
MLCYSVRFDGTGLHIERLKQLMNVPVELVLNIDELREMSVFEIAEPILEEGIEVTAVKLDTPLSQSSEEDVEKAIVLADELNSDLIVLPVEGERLQIREGSPRLDSLFKSASVYAKKVVFEPHPRALPGLADLISEFLGGVFKLAVSPEPELNTEELIELAHEHLGQLVLVRLVCFTREGKVARISGTTSPNVFAIIKELLERGYEGFFVLDYEPRGLMLPSQLVREDLELLLQYVRSMMGRVK